MGLETFNILYRFNYLGFNFVYYYCNVTTVLELHFSRLLSRSSISKKVWVVFSMIGLPQRVLMAGMGLCLYGFMIDHALEEAILVYVLYWLKKIRFLKSHCTEFEYFKDSSIVYTDISCFDLTIDS